MATKIVKTGDIVLSNNPDDVLKTFALGPCIALAVYEPEKRVAGLLHIALPDSTINPSLSIGRPGYFVDTAIPKLLARLIAYNCLPEDLIIKLAGGSNILDQGRIFDIGDRNITAVRSLLQQYNLRIAAKDVGGSRPRTVALYVKTGQMLIKSGASATLEL